MIYHVKCFNKKLTRENYYGVYNIQPQKEENAKLLSPTLLVIK